MERHVVHQLDDAGRKEVLGNLALGGVLEHIVQEQRKSSHRTVRLREPGLRHDLRHALQRMNNDRRHPIGLAESLVRMCVLGVSADRPLHALLEVFGQRHALSTIPVRVNDPLDDLEIPVSRLFVHHDASCAARSVFGVDAGESVAEDGDVVQDVSELVQDASEPAPVDIQNEFMQPYSNSLKRYTAPPLFRMVR